jgi:DNA polymerase (family X)
MNRLVRKADVTRAIAAARGSLEPRQQPPLSREDAVAELSRVPGLGPARAGVVYDELGVCTLPELQAAVADGRLAAVRGFGGATAARIAAAVEALLDPRTWLPIAEAELHVQRLVAYMNQAPAVQGVEAAGAFRRRCDVVDSIVLLVVSSRPSAVMRYFHAYADAVSTEAQDPSRGALVLQCGLRVELRIVPGRCHGAVLHHVTGSPEYEAAVRTLGLERGVRVSDYGVFLLEPGRAGARRVGGQKEEDVFTALGMQWVPPELRENDGEIEAALLQALPSLIRMEDLRGDLRLRTRRSTGTAPIEELLRACRNARYSYCAIADPVGGVTSALDAHQLREQAEELAVLRGRYPSLRVLHGVEIAILEDGALDLTDDVAALADMVIATPGGRFRGSATRATDRLLRALEDPRLHILACITGRVIGERPPVEAHYDEVFRAAAQRGVAIELSAEPRRLDPPRSLLRAAAAAGAGIIISSGAGTVDALGDIRFGVDQARRGWLEPANVLNTREWTGIAAWLEGLGRKVAV